MKTKYHRWYLALIKRAKNRSCDLNHLYERHHVKPRSLGGSDNKRNLVLLTGREHFLAHWLLIKMFNGQKRWKMLAALHRMCFMGDRIIRTGWQYEIARKAAKQARIFQGPPFLGHQHTARSKRKIKMSLLARDGKVGWAVGQHRHSEETKRQMSTSQKGNQNNKMWCAKTRARLSRTKRRQAKNPTPAMKAGWKLIAEALKGNQHVKGKRWKWKTSTSNNFNGSSIGVS